MSTVSLGDMARHLMLRRQTAAADRDLASLGADLAKGTASDTHRHLGGDLAPLASIEAGLAANSAFRSAVDRGAFRAAAMQTALDRVNRAAGDRTVDLLITAQAGQTVGLATVGARSRAALEDVLAALNTRVEGTSLFSGTATDATPLPDADDLLGLVATVVAPATAPADIAAALDIWLADPAGFAVQAYRGNGDVRQVPVAPGQTIRLDATAADPALRSTLKGLLLGAMMASPAFTSDPSAQRTLAQLAGESLIAARDDRVALSARLGMVEERLSNAQTRQTAEASVLQQARSGLISIDGYTVATRLQETEARLDLIYTLTARLSRLSLAEYV
ncbi:flagellin [Tabrizicola sp. M-4]|uniref:flagellin n=1 Tax=Tabrizicola sp. M-4 TaxID=3055847 RepID=UPI003DA8C45B